MHTSTLKTRADTPQITRLEEQLQRLKDLNKRNNEVAKSRFANHAQERDKLNATVAELEAQILALTTERDELKASSQDTATADSLAKEQNLVRELEALRAEKAELEKRLQEAGTASSGTQSAEAEQLKAELVSQTYVGDRGFGIDRYEDPGQTRERCIGCRESFLGFNSRFL